MSVGLEVKLKPAVCVEYFGGTCERLNPSLRKEICLWRCSYA